MDSIRRLLVRQPLLSNFDPNWLDLIRPMTRLANFGRGSPVLRAGEPAGEFYLLSEGTVAVRATYRTGDSDSQFTLCTLRAGDLLGASWLLGERRWIYDVVALDAVEALAIDVNDFLIVCERQHSFGYCAMKAVGQVFAHRLRETGLQICDVYADWS